MNERVEAALFAVVPERHILDVVRCRTDALRLAGDRVARDVEELGIPVDESLDEPGTGDAIGARMLASYPAGPGSMLGRVAPTHPRGFDARTIVVILRWTFRAAACLCLIALAACGAAPAGPTPRPNEVQVVEPAGREPAWTFSPKELRVSPGTTVTFVNMGTQLHTVTSSDEGRPFDVGLDSGKRATITFDKGGVFAYHCGVHPQMTGVIRVCDGACS